MQAEIEDWCKAAQVPPLPGLEPGPIGRPYPGMMDLYIDETNLYHRMWLYTKQFDWEKCGPSPTMSPTRPPSARRPRTF
ncbi:MAG: hypothetical protein ACLRSY_01925 [Acutalibacter sp.]